MDDVTVSCQNPSRSEQIFLWHRIRFHNTLKQINRILKHRSAVVVLLNIETLTEIFCSHLVNIDDCGNSGNDEAGPLSHVDPVELETTSSQRSIG